MAHRDPVARAEYNKKYRAKRREELNERERRRYHEEGGRERNAAYRTAHLEQYAKYQRDRRQQNPQEALVNQARSRAKRDGLPCNITLENMDWPTHCPIFGVELDYNRTTAGDRKIRTNSPTIDRRTNNLGYVIGNAFVISHRANRIKSDATVEELEAVLRYMRS